MVSANLPLRAGIDAGVGGSQGFSSSEKEQQQIRGETRDQAAGVPGDDTRNVKLYFAYGSNLSLHQMRMRCPDSSYYGFGILRGWRWIISQRGYANVIQVVGDVMGRKEVQRGRESSAAKNEALGFVEGMVYTLTEQGQARLDSAEGVPYAYSKHMLEIDVLSSSAGADARMVKALVYVDLKRTTEATCVQEYVGRMNRGIRDARTNGMSELYVESVLRNWIPEEGDRRGSEGPVFA